MGHDVKDDSNYEVCIEAGEILRERGISIENKERFFAGIWFSV